MCLCFKLHKLPKAANILLPLGGPCLSLQNQSKKQSVLSSMRPWPPLPEKAPNPSAKLRPLLKEPESQKP